MLEIWGSGLVLNRLDAPTFQVFLVALQLRGQQAPERTQTSQCRHHGVIVVHVSIVVALPAAQAAAEEIKPSLSSLMPIKSLLWSFLSSKITNNYAGTHIRGVCRGQSDRVFDSYIKT